MKTCTKCNKILPHIEFYKDKAHVDGRRTSCRSCDKIKAQNWNKANPTKHKLHQDNFKELNSEKVKQHEKKYRLSLYNLEASEYNQMFTNQNGCCLICKRHQSQFRKSLSVDHCHKTGKVRGLLCQNCNSALGFLEDEVTRFKSAIEYLEKFKF